MELVRLALEEEGSIAALARKHDVNDNLLFKWIRLWQREGRVCRPRKNSSSLPALIPVQLQAGSSLPTFELPSCSPPATCHIKCRGGEITLTHPSAELMSTVLRELMRGRYDKSSRRHKNLAGCRYTDMRNGFNGLAAKVQTALKMTDVRPRLHLPGTQRQSGKTALVHRRWSVPLTKRLERGRFARPQPAMAKCSDAGATGDADGRYRLATAKAVTDILTML